MEKPRIRKLSLHSTETLIVDMLIIGCKRPEIAQKLNVKASSIYPKISMMLQVNSCKTFIELAYLYGLQEGYELGKLKP